MTKTKKLLGFGCSHASGAEIDGSMDSDYNRKHSFGAVLAESLDRHFVSLSSHGSTNATIARMIIEYIENNYEEDTDDLFVLIPWTESIRIEIPSMSPIWYNEVDKGMDYHSKTYHNYHRVNLGLTEADGYPIDLQSYQKFIAENENYFQIYSANLVLQIQYYLKSKNIPYVMCNTMHMFTESKWINFYLDRIDKSCYMDCLDNESAFYWYYKNQGYENPKATYWHHDETPHQMFAEKLRKFVVNNRILDR